MVAAAFDYQFFRRLVCLRHSSIQQSYEAAGHCFLDVAWCVRRWSSLLHPLDPIQKPRVDSHRRDLLTARDSSDATYCKRSNS